MKTGGSQHSWRTRIGLIVTALLVLQSAIPLNKLAVQAAPVRATTYPCDIEVSYTGMDTTHVAYDATGCSEYTGANRVDLMVTVNGSTSTLALRRYKWDIPPHRAAALRGRRLFLPVHLPGGPSRRQGGILFQFHDRWIDARDFAV